MTENTGQILLFFVEDTKLTLYLWLAHSMLDDFMNLKEDKTNTVLTEREVKSNARWPLNVEIN